MRTILFVILLFSIPSISFAQKNQKARINLPFIKKEVAEKEKNRLIHSIDSLQAVIDSLSKRTLELEEPIVDNDEMTGSRISTESRKEYSPELTDSLIKVWYKSNFGDNRFSPSLCTDSIRLSSNVPDSEMVHRLERINSFISLPFNDVVRNYMILYSEKMPSDIGRLLSLSEYYFPILEEALIRYNLPLELKYLSIVESKLKPAAVSRAGARGIWQFMFHTARIYGLKIDSFVDERLDVVKASDAAARYLRDAYETFGDWSLAISSYNCGAGNVLKAMRRSGQKDFWSIYYYLPRETRGYLPAMIGAMYAFNYAADYGIVPSEAGIPAIVDTIMVNRNLHLNQVNEVVGIPIDILRHLNPMYYHDILPGDSARCELRIPYEWTDAFLTANIDTIYAHNASKYISPKIIKEIQDDSNPNRRIAHKVKSGEYLGKIAAKYHVSVASIKKWNNLKSDKLRIGQILYINAHK